jgi:CubicO group peptidase (beta-lactamase class C family)
MNKTITLIGIFLLLCLQLTPLRAQDQSEAPQNLDELKAEVEKTRKAHGIEAIGIAFIGPDGESWTQSLGRSNIKDEINANTDTLFRIGSTSKMFVGLAALKLRQEGLIDFNSEVRELAPEIPFTNQWEAEHPVRFVHLLEHTTGWDDIRPKEYAHNQANPIERKEALLLYPESRESRWVPGTRHAYCNSGPAVAAYIIEKITGQSFEEYVEKTFFLPIGMSSATYFQPEDYRSRAALAYANGKELEYWHIMYRSSGSINASPKDMEAFLSFMINRGRVGEQQLLLESSIERMQTPSSTLGAIKGIKAGYGIYNYSSGQGKGIPFYGHNGAVFGAFSDFSYSPELKAGFALTTTGAPPFAVSEIFKNYIIRNQEQRHFDSVELFDEYQEWQGLYRPINPRNKTAAMMIELAGSMKFSVDDQGFHRSPVFGGWTSTDVALEDGTLIDPWLGLSKIAIVEDPIAGPAIQVEGELYQKISPVNLFGKLAFLSTFGILLILSTFYTPIWVINRLRGKIHAGGPTQLRIWPSLASLSFALTQIINIFAIRDIEAIGTLSFLSFLMFAGPIVALVTAMIGSWMLWKYRADKGAIFWLSLLMTSCHLLACMYLASYGLLGMRTWA